MPLLSISLIKSGGEYIYIFTFGYSLACYPSPVTEKNWTEIEVADRRRYHQPECAQEFRTSGVFLGSILYMPNWMQTQNSNLYQPIARCIIKSARFSIVGLRGFNYKEKKNIG